MITHLMHVCSVSICRPDVRLHFFIHIIKVIKSDYDEGTYLICEIPFYSFTLVVAIVSMIVPMLICMFANAHTY